MFSLTTDSDERRLAERLRSGDNAAMSLFYACYGQRLTAVCARYIASEEDLKDVVQDTLVNIFTHIGDFSCRGPGSLYAWSVRIAVNESLKYLKRTRQYELRQMDNSVADLADEDDDPPISDVPPDVIQHMISSLPTGYRTVFNLYVLEGHSHRDIARLLSISESTSTSQLLRAKRQLCKMILDYLNSEQSNQ